MKYVRSALVLLSLSVPPASAQPPDFKNEAVVVEQWKTTMRFETDGTGRRELVVRLRTQSDAGVQQWGQLVVGYNAATEKIEFPYIRVRKPDGSVIETPASAIQDLTSPVERVAPVYTDLRQKHATVQSLRPGDTLEFDVITTIHTALAAGQFWTEYSFNDEGIVLDEQLSIDVPASRKVLLKARSGYEAAAKEQDGRRVYRWTHSHTVREDPNAKKTTEAPNPDDPVYPEIRLTTFENWEQVGRWFAGLEQPARAVTPDVRQKAEELTKGLTTQRQKLEALYDYVAKNFRYVSLSLGVGRYQPRPAANVLRDAYGDCKDKHTLLASLIDAAGLKASAALINADAELDPDFPSPSQFNHVITRATADGATVWLDSTPEVAPFGFLLFPLRDKRTLVADLSTSRLEITPVQSDVTGRNATSFDGSIDESGALHGDASFEVRGDPEVLLRSAFRSVPSAQWTTLVEQIVKQAGIDAKASNVAIADPLKTSVPFNVAFHVDVSDYVRWNGRQVQVPLPFLMPPAIGDVPEKGRITLSAYGDVSYRIRLRLPAAADARAPAGVTVSRDYAEYRATYAVADHVFTAERRLTVRTPRLPGSRRDDYVAFAGVVLSDAKQQLGVDAAHMPAAAGASAEAEATLLNERGVEALREGDYEQAVKFLKRTVALEPKDKTAWNALGRAYAGLHDIAAAIDAYKKQIEVNPYDAYAYNNLGLAYVEVRRYDEAEAAYLKQLEINPLNGYAAGNLGHMYVEQGKFEKAVVALEKAASVSPKDEMYQIRLGKAYLALHQLDKARAAFDRAMELSPTPFAWNNIAYELSLARVDLDRAQRLAESAVSTLVAASRNVDAAHATAAALETTDSLVTYWDTLGWVAFVKGDVATAEKYVSAAWTVAQAAEVGDHLGQILEKEGRRDDAAVAYARALSAERPDPAVRDHLVALVGASRADALVAAHKADLVRSRELTIPGKGTAGKTAEFFVVFAAPGNAEGVQFIDGDASLQTLAGEIARLRVTGAFPDEQPARLLRRMAVACGADGRCTGTLVLPSDARPAR